MATNLSTEVWTYSPFEVTISCGSHIVVGVAEDSFVTIEPNGDGITKKVGCYGDVVRAISPDSTYKIKITLLQSSKSNQFFSEQYDLDHDTGDGTFSLLIKDLRGGEIFSAAVAWVVNKPSLTRGKESNNREWEIDTGHSTLEG